MSAYEMMGIIENLINQSAWVVLIFNEISGYRLSVNEEDFLFLLDYLKRREQEIWLAPVVEVAENYLLRL